MSRTVLWRALFVALLVFVTYMTLTPNPDDTEGELSFARWISELLFGTAAFGDKVAHVLAYASLGAAAMFAQIHLAGRAAVTLIALAAYGVLLEALQGLGGVRTADAIDALANASGAVMGAGAHYAAHLLDRLRRTA
jgi:hypothetical protein